MGTHGLCFTEGASDEATKNRGLLFEVCHGQPVYFSLRPI